MLLVSVFDQSIVTDLQGVGFNDIRCTPSVYDALTASDVPDVVKTMCVTLSDSLTCSETYASKTYTYGYQFIDSPFLGGGKGIKFTASGTIS